MPFQKGISGNPKGRPKTGQALAESCRRFVEKRNPELLKELIHLALEASDKHGHPDGRVRVEAMKLLYTVARVIGTHINTEEMPAVPLFALPAGVYVNLSPKQE